MMGIPSSYMLTNDFFMQVKNLIELLEGSILFVCFLFIGKNGKQGHVTTEKNLSACYFFICFQINKPFQGWGGQKWKNTAFNLLRYIFWMYFTEFALHFFYVNAIGYQPDVRNTLKFGISKNTLTSLFLDCQNSRSMDAIWLRLLHGPVFSEQIRHRLRSFMYDLQSGRYRGTNTAQMYRQNSSLL